MHDAGFTTHGVGVSHTALRSKICGAGVMVHSAAGVTTQDGGVATNATIRMRLVDVSAPNMMRRYTYLPKTDVDKGMYAKPDTESRGPCSGIPASLHVACMLTYQ